MVESKSLNSDIQISCPALLQVDWLTFEKFPNNSSKPTGRHFNRINGGLELTLREADRSKIDIVLCAHNVSRIRVDTAHPCQSAR